MPTPPGHNPLGNEGAVYGAIFAPEAATKRPFNIIPENTTVAAQRIKHELKKGPDDALKAVQEWKEPIPAAELYRAVDENAGSQDRAHGTGLKPRTADESARYTREGIYVKNIDRLMSVGYDKLAANEKAAVRGYVEIALRRIPAVDAYLNSGVVAKAQALEELIHNPNFAKHLRSVVEARMLDENGKAKIIENKVPEAEENQEQAKIQYDTKKAEHDDVEKDLEQVKHDLSAFEVGNPTTLPAVPRGSRADDIDFGLGRGAVNPDSRASLEKKVVLRQRLIDRDQNTLDDLRRERDSISSRMQIQTAMGGIASGPSTALESRYRDIFRDIAIVEGRVKLNEDFLAEAQSLLKSNETALQERDELLRKKAELTDRFTKVKAELVPLDGAHKKAARDYVTAKVDRETEERAFEKNVSEVIGAASVEAFQEEVERAQGVQAELLEAAEKEAKSQEEKAMNKAIRLRYTKTRTIVSPFHRREVVRVKNPKKVNEDFNILVRTKDPEDVMLRVLTDSGMSLSVARAAMSQPEFVQKYQNKLLKELIKHKIEKKKDLGGENTRRVLLNNDWGTDLLDAAVAEDASANELVEQLRKQGVIRGKFSDWVRSTRTGAFAGWTALALGMVPAAGLGIHLAAPAASLASIIQGTAGPLGGAAYVAGAKTAGEYAAGAAVAAGINPLRKAA